MQDASSSYMACKTHPLILKTCILSHQKLTTQLDSLDSSTKEACYGKSFIKNNFSHLHNRFSKWNEFLVHLQHQTMWLETCTARKKNFESQLLVLFHLWILWGKQKKKTFQYLLWYTNTEVQSTEVRILELRHDDKYFCRLHTFPALEKRFENPDWNSMSKKFKAGRLYIWQKFSLKHIL